MCVVSNIGDMGMDMWPKPWVNPLTPNYPYKPYDPEKMPAAWPSVPAPYIGPTKEQFEEFLKLMRQAKKLDAALGLPDCEAAEKVQWLKELGKFLGCDVSDLVR